MILKAYKYKFYTVLLALMIALSACSSNSKVIKSGSVDEKFELAKSYYQHMKYNRSLPIFLDLLGQYRDSKKSEEIYYYIAYSYYGMREYESAGRYFYNFTETFYNSKKTEECFFMYCMCQYYASDPYYLDQSLTKRAIENFQLFLNLFPGSVYQDDANESIEKLRRKLKKKEFENALMYYKMEDYKAAMVVLNLCLESFPDIEEKEEIEFLIFKSAYKYASLSVQDKQIERYKEALKYYKEYVSENRNSQSDFFKEAQSLKVKIDENIQKLEKINSI